MKIIKQLNALQGIPRYIIILSSLIGVGVLIYAIMCFLRGGVYNIFLSRNIVSLGMSVFAEGVIFGLFGDVLIKRMGNR